MEGHSFEGRNRRLLKDPTNVDSVTQDYGTVRNTLQQDNGRWTDTRSSFLEAVILAYWITYPITHTHTQTHIVFIERTRGSVPVPGMTEKDEQSMHNRLRYANKEKEVYSPQEEMSLNRIWSPQQKMAKQLFFDARLLRLVKVGPPSRFNSRDKSLAGCSCDHVPHSPSRLFALVDIWVGFRWLPCTMLRRLDLGSKPKVFGGQNSSLGSRGVCLFSEYHCVAVLKGHHKERHNLSGSFKKSETSRGLQKPGVPPRLLARKHRPLKR